MSAFLGPIHYWLYNKIQLQEELIQDIATYGEKSGWPIFSEKHLEEKTVNKELRPLNELIDVMNIHGWLQERGEMSLRSRILPVPPGCRKRIFMRRSGML